MADPKNTRAKPGIRAQTLGLAARAMAAPQPALRSCAVQEEDLAHTGDLLDLLHALNDAHAAVGKLDELIQRISVLEARILAKAPKGGPDAPMDLGRALLLIGNRGLEAVLLELLEDLTVFKAELEDR